ncbi:hypothetical protein HZA39_04670 [Candidatus Peregrinibacteria bacterium]|nr:hypothetical protein [Candidatus Peregrinibacteria bacterium]
MLNSLAKTRTSLIVDTDCDDPRIDNLSDILYKWGKKTLWVDAIDRKITEVTSDASLRTLRMATKTASLNIIHGVQTENILEDGF